LPGWSAFQQLQTYQAEVPALFAPNALLAVADGVEARVGTLGAGREWFKPWRTIAGETLAGAHLPELQVVIEGLCAPRRFLDLLRDFIVFEDDGGRIVKKMAGYHQFHAVRVAVGETLRTIARELVKTVRANVTIDWTLRENVRAQLRVLVKRILRRYGYPPDKQEKATMTVLEQAALLSAEWAAA
jgi:type I site-specific restriction-modification system R (restriction) subunit